MINYQKELDRITAALVSRPRLALHSCCGPCSTYVLEYLTHYFDVTLFFYNPNIHPEDEYKKRLAAQHTVCDAFGVDIVECDYDAACFFERVTGLENEPEGGARCTVCFQMRLENTARIARDNGFDLLATTLTVSPHKNAPLINEIGEGICREFGIRWLPSDFKKKGGYLRSTQLSREYDIYRQNYCGCIYSKN